MILRRPANAHRHRFSSGPDQFDLPYRHSLRHTCILDIAADEKTMWDGMRGRTPETPFARPRNPRFIWCAVGRRCAIFSRLFVAHDGKVGSFHNVNYFQSIADTIGPDGEIFAAYRNQTRRGRHARSLRPRDGQLFMGSRQSGFAVRAGRDNICSGEMVKACIARGISRLDLGESSKRQRDMGLQIRVRRGAPSTFHYYDVMRKKDDAPSQAPGRQFPAAPRLSLAGRVEAFVLASCAETRTQPGFCSHPRRASGSIVPDGDLLDVVAGYFGSARRSPVCKPMARVPCWG
jgi:hypothetical protein